MKALVSLVVALCLTGMVSSVDAREPVVVKRAANVVCTAAGCVKNLASNTVDVVKDVVSVPVQTVRQSARKCQCSVRQRFPLRNQILTPPVIKRTRWGGDVVYPLYVANTNPVTVN